MLILVKIKSYFNFVLSDLSAFASCKFFKNLFLKKLIFLLSLYIIV